MLGNLPEEQRGKVSAQLLANAADLGMVESCALLGNSRDNGFVGVNLYCDDEAAFVDAPLNPRASEIAACCGKPMQVWAAGPCVCCCACCALLQRMLGMQRPRACPHAQHASPCTLSSEEACLRHAWPRASLSYACKHACGERPQGSVAMRG